MKPVNDQEENELVILHLRLLCEAKQKTHVHIGEGPAVRTDFLLDLMFLFICLVKISQNMWKEFLYSVLSSSFRLKSCRTFFLSILEVLEGTVTALAHGNKIMLVLKCKNMVFGPKSIMTNVRDLE